MQHLAIEFRANADGVLGVFAKEALVAGAIVERCYCVLLKRSAIPGDLLLPWLYDCGQSDDETLLFPFGWGMLYNEQSHDGSVANMDWAHETGKDVNGAELNYIVLRAKTDINPGDELCCSHRLVGTGKGRDVMRALFEAVSADPDIVLPEEASVSKAPDSGAADLDVAHGILSSSRFRDIAMRCSPLHGNGVYAQRAFAKGELVEIAPNLLINRWELGMCLIDYRFNLWSGFNEEERLAAGHTSLPSGVKVALGLGSIFNHKDEPNIGHRPATASGCTPAQSYMTCYYTLCDIAEGEEMFISYGKQWWESRAEKSASLAEWRLKRGETASGRPFYDDPALKETLKNPAMIEKLHRAFVNCEGVEPSPMDVSMLNVWMDLCSKLEAKESSVRGGINTPLRESGERALHRAAEAGHVRKLKWLIVHGADVGAATAPALDMSPAGDMSSSLYPAHVAAIHGRVEALRILQSSGADMNCSRPDGATPLDFAEDVGQDEAAAWLLAHGGIRGIAEG